MARGDVFSNRSTAPDRSERGASIALAAVLTIVQIGGLVEAGSRLTKTPDVTRSRSSAHAESITYLVDVGPHFFGASESLERPATGSTTRPGLVRDTAAGESVVPPGSDRSVSDGRPERDARLPLATIFDRPCVGPACINARRITVPALPRRGAVVDRAFRDSVWRAFREDFPRLAAKQLPPTQEETDRMWRAKSLAASGNIGLVEEPAIMAGASIPIGLPFGGPSKEERARDAALHRENTARLARIDSAGRARIDSLYRLGIPCRVALAAPVRADSTISALDLSSC